MQIIGIEVRDSEGERCNLAREEEAHVLLERERATAVAVRMSRDSCRGVTGEGRQGVSSTEHRNQQLE